MTSPEPVPDKTSGPAPAPGKTPVRLILYIDGGSSGNPGPCGAAAIIKDEEETTLLEKARAFGPATNNVAEYQALLLGLEAAATLRPTHLTIRSDSELLVRQLAGQYKIRAPNLKPLHREAMQKLDPFDSVEIQHIPRSQNAEADKLCHKAMEKARQVDAELPAAARKTPAHKTFRLK